MARGEPELGGMNTAGDERRGEKTKERKKKKKKLILTNVKKRRASTDHSPPKPRVRLRRKLGESEQKLLCDLGEIYRPLKLSGSA